MKKSILKSYARLIVRKGVNVQKGQDVVIQAAVSDEYFVKYVMEEAYKAGARLVSVEWSSDVCGKIAYQYADVKALAEFPLWKREKMKYQVKTLPAKIWIDSMDPDAMNGVDQEKITGVRRIMGPKVMKYREQMDNKYQWTIVGIPSYAWAHKVFPDDTKKDAMNKLWDAILKTTRVYGNPIENWDLHNANLREKYTKLNEMGIKRLHYSASNGTDFTIDIKECMAFNGGDEATLGGVIYNPNMPTEECFTSPDKYSAQGTVYASKPLSVMGKLVDHFGFTFKDGKVIQVHAEKPEDKEVLEKLVSLDEGASRLGEVALVPFDSPVNQTGVLFFNTLYDENACCHLALGHAFNECIRGYENMSEEEIKKVDLNDSMIHVDFMIGTRDLKITAECYDGKNVTIFENGTWAF